MGHNSAFDVLDYVLDYVLDNVRYYKRIDALDYVLDCVRIDVRDYVRIDVQYLNGMSFRSKRLALISGCKSVAFIFSVARIWHCRTVAPAADTDFRMQRIK